MGRYPGMPSLLDTIARDATQYFILIFFVQLLALLFMFIAPVGDARSVWGVVNRVVLIVCISSGEGPALAGSVSFLFSSTSKWPSNGRY